MATLFGKIFKGIGKAVKAVAPIAAGLVGIPMGSATAVQTYPQPTVMGGMLPEVTVTATGVNPDPSAKTVSQKLLDALDVVSGNRSVQVEAGISSDTLPKWAIPAAIMVAVLFVIKILFGNKKG